ncbi:MAG: hypothetical protein IJX80_07930 [Clostridia bacterium]|nr:hypothetical protein [Clostridia bacterium]
MREIKDSAQELIDNYADALAQNGIRLAVSKRYFESTVRERNSSANTGGVILNVIDRALDKKREEKSYHYQRNQYHSLVLTVLPTDSRTVTKGRCKEYAFLLRKLERPHIGVEPQKKCYEEQKILRKVEKRILKIIQKAETHPTVKVCRDTWRDALRYTSAAKYGYKTTILGKDYSFWDILFAGLAGLCTIAFVFTAWLIFQLFQAL